MIYLHVLLVGDDIEARRAVEAALALDPFFTLRVSADGAQAVKTAVAWRPDLILLDVMMPDVDGPAFVARLRADRRTAPVPVVFLTAHTELREHEWYRALGAVGVIAKPFDALKLAAEVRRFVAVEGVLSPAREGFFRRLEADACALSDCRVRLKQRQPEPALIRINQIAHSLAGAGGIFGFAGITCASAALSDAAENNLAGRAKPIEVERALNRLLKRIAPL